MFLSEEIEKEKTPIALLLPRWIGLYLQCQALHILSKFNIPRYYLHINNR